MIAEPSAADILVHCRAALVTSGTATLETALLGIPQVALYRSSGSKTAYNVMRRILTIPYVTLPNLIADSGVIPELLMHHCNAEEVSEALAPLLREDSPARLAQLEGYAAMRRALGSSNAASTAAGLIVRTLEGEKSAYDAAVD